MKDLFTELSLELSDENLSTLNELAISLNYNDRSILASNTNDFKISLGPEIDEFVKKFNGDVHIGRFKPACHIIWHKDISPIRTCVINVPLKKYNNQATYITNQDIQKSFGQRNAFPNETVNAEIHRPYRIPYNYKKLYLINVSEKYHCVFNDSNEYRYLLGIQTGEINYQQALEYFTNLGLVNQ